MGTPLLKKDYVILGPESHSAAGCQKETDLCGKDTENYVPCYNVSANLMVGYQNREEFDRHWEHSNLRRSVGGFYSKRTKSLFNGLNFDDVKDCSCQTAEMIRLGSGSEFLQA
ncbi:hypothetical protein ACFE04_004679 [Oxalis oulophora]